MKLTIHRDQLADAVAWAARVVPQRPTVPILAGLLVEAAEDDTLTISAFDYDVSAKCTVQADVAEPGRVVVGGRMLAEVAKSLPGKPVEMALTGSEVELRCGTAELRMLTMPVEDFPALPKPPATLGQMNGAALRAAIAQVLPASDSNSAVIALTGICFDMDEDGLELATTDGYRIAARTLDWQPALDSPVVQAVVPAKVLGEISRGLGGGPVDLAADDSLFGLSAGGRQAVLRLLDTDFVNYRRAFTSLNLPITAKVDVSPLVEAIKRVGLVAEPLAPIRLAFTGEQVEVSAGGADAGRGSEAVAATLEGADDVTVRLQRQMILDGLTGVDGDVATFSMLASHKPMLIAGDDPSYRYLAMTLRDA